MDYIFYRIYKGKINKNQSPLLGAMLFLYICIILLFLPIIGNLSYLLGVGKNNIKVFSFIFCFIIFIYIYYRYAFRNKYKSIILKYEKKHLKNEIPLWVLELAYPICVVIGISLWGGIYKYIIQEYNLEGKLGELILSVFK
jgi:amino acid transporter